VGKFFKKLVILLKCLLDRLGGEFPMFARRFALAVVVSFERGRCNLIHLDAGICPLMASGVL
jgi:hypothetical protein